MSSVAIKYRFAQEKFLNVNFVWKQDETSVKFGGW